MRCIICHHSQRAEIDGALIAGAVPRKIAIKYHIDPKSVYRHRKNHLAQIIKENAAAYAKHLVEELYSLTAAAKRLGRNAEAAAQYGSALGAIATERGIIELVAKLTGQLDGRTQINILMQQAEQANQEQEVMLSRLTIEERKELRRLILKAEGRSEAIETDYHSTEESDDRQLRN